MEFQINWKDFQKELQRISKESKKVAWISNGFLWISRGMQGFPKDRQRFSNDLFQEPKGIQRISKEILKGIPRNFWRGQPAQPARVRKPPCEGPCEGLVRRCERATPEPGHSRLAQPGSRNQARVCGRHQFSPNPLGKPCVG